MSASYGIIDLFAGPGGLGEGFSSTTEGKRTPFQIAVSIEKEASAHRTLRLRSFLRAHKIKTGQLPSEYLEFYAGRADEPDWSKVDREAWVTACREALCLELGTAGVQEEVDRHLENARQKYADTILIGGPPCQAYSLVGRARSRGIDGYRAEDDHRHFLFREYIRVLDRLRPAAFVLENVKGVLSSKVDGRPIFEEIMHDISSLGGANQDAYALFALTFADGRISLVPAHKASDYIVRAEQFGVPQRRHRVIVIGLRHDLAPLAASASISADYPIATVTDAIGNLTPLRSGLSKSADDLQAWVDTVNGAARHLLALLVLPQHSEERAKISKIVSELEDLTLLRRNESLPATYGASNIPVRRYLENAQLDAIAHHETRGHMVADLERYLFSAVFGQVHGRAAKKDDYPLALAPAHKSWMKDIFGDRFRVQLADEPATTITSHIAKDGHYFIHPDPLQCRSLTVREAARLQTFPDDYFFMGNRTQQYVQVGNAVPPLLASQIARLLLAVLDQAAPEKAQTSSDELATV